MFHTFLMQCWVTCLALFLLIQASMILNGTISVFEWDSRSCCPFERNSSLQQIILRTNNAKASPPKKLVELNALRECIDHDGGSGDYTHDARISEVFFWTVELRLLSMNTVISLLPNLRIKSCISSLYCEKPKKKLRGEFLKRLWRLWFWNYLSCK